MKKIAVLAVGLALSGCIGSGDEQGYNDTATVWKLSSMNGKAISGDSTLQFSENGISGKGNCNRFRAEQKAEYPAFDAGPIAATRRACIQPMDDESAYFQALEKMTTASMTKDQLVLTGPDGGELVFTPEM